MILQQIPKPVLGGATLVMFGTVAAAGIKIISTVEMNRRTMLILAVCFGLGLGQALRPELFNQMPALFRSVFSSPVSMAGISAIVMTLIIPQPKLSEDEEEISPDVAV